MAAVSASRSALLVSVRPTVSSAVSSGTPAVDSMASVEAARALSTERQAGPIPGTPSSVRSMRARTVGRRHRSRASQNPPASSGSHSHQPARSAVDRPSIARVRSGSCTLVCSKTETTCGTT